MAIDCEVLVLGAGMSGLCIGAELVRAGIRDFVIVEQSAGLGGTWWDNRYPGAHVDVPAPLYAFSFAPSAKWTRRFAAAPEIQRYMEDVADRYGLRLHCRFGERIVEARFDEACGRWAVSGDNGSTWRARFFVCSTGPLSRPHWPAIDGLESFAGRRLHSARWDGHYDPAGRRIAVIGTGSTATQLIPPLAAKAAHLLVFQRTANWVLPRPDRRYGAADRVLARLPPYSALVRHTWYGLLEWGRRAFDEGSIARRRYVAAAHALRSRQLPDAALRARLEPPYPFGCKRIVYSNDYYPALAQANVELVTDRIVRITPDAVVTADGRERVVDTLVCATGFDVEHSLGHIAIVGRGGRRLDDVWRDAPQAHLGLTVAGFPNLFLMLGPNTATGHTSTLLFIEPGARWAVRAMQEVRRRGVRWLDVTPLAMAASNAALQARLGGSVWNACRSWYRAEGGRIFAIWPGYTRDYVRAVRQQDYSRDFEFG